MHRYRRTSNRRCKASLISASRSARQSSRTCWMRASNAATPFSALRADRALPSSVVGPVAHSQGFVARHNCACRSRRSFGHADLVPKTVIPIQFVLIAASIMATRQATGWASQRHLWSAGTACWRTADLMATRRAETPVSRCIGSRSKECRAFCMAERRTIRTQTPASWKASQSGDLSSTRWPRCRNRSPVICKRQVQRQSPSKGFLSGSNSLGVKPFKSPVAGSPTITTGSRAASAASRFIRSAARDCGWIGARPE